MDLRTETTASFARGANDSADATAYRQDEVAWIVNGRVRPDATLEARRGSKRLHSAALGGGEQGYGGASFMRADGTAQWIVFFGPTAYVSSDDGANWTQIATGLRRDYWSLCTMRVGATNYLLCVNGGTAYKWDGSTWSVLAGCPSGAKFGAVFNERFYVAGHNGNIVQASAIADPEKWTIPDGLAFQIQTHDGDDQLTGLYAIASVLLVFKRHSTSYVNGFGYSDLVVAAGASGLSRSVGCIGWRTIKAADAEGIMWLSERGVERYVPGGRIELVSNRLRTFFKNISWDGILADQGEPTALFYPQEHEYWLALPAAGAQNNYIYVYNTATGANALYQYGSLTGGTVFNNNSGYFSFTDESGRSLMRVESGYLRVATGSETGVYGKVGADGYFTLVQTAHDNAVLFQADIGGRPSAPIGCGYDGFVRHLDTGTKDDALSNDTGGNLVTLVVEDRPHLFGDRWHRKRARIIEALVVAPDGGVVDLSLMVDGVEKQTHSITIEPTQLNRPQRIFARVNGRGYSLQVKARSTDAVAIASLGMAAERLAGHP